MFKMYSSKSVKLCSTEMERSSSRDFYSDIANLENWLALRFHAVISLLL